MAVVKRELLPGIVVELAGREYQIPPLTLGQMRRLMPQIGELAVASRDMDERQIDILVSIVGAALRRNYPQMSDETVADLLDLGNAGAVLNAVLTGSGVRAARPGEDQAAGIGIPSMGSSPPASAIASPTSTL